MRENVSMRLGHTEETPTGDLSQRGFASLIEVINTTRYLSYNDSLPMPQFCILCRQIKIQVAVVYTRLDHCSFEPLIEGRDGDPIGVACNRCHPARAVCRSIVARYNIGPRPSWHSCIVVAWQHSCCPDFLGVVRAIVSINVACEIPGQPLPCHHARCPSSQH